MLNDRSPFQRETSFDTLIALANETPLGLFDVLPVRLARLIALLLAKEPGRLPQTATEALKVVLTVERSLLAPKTIPQVPAAIVPVPVVRPAAPPVAFVVPTTAPRAELEEEFEYVIDGIRREGTRRVLGLDIRGGQTMKFVRIEKGILLMGAPIDEEGAISNEKPQRRLTISRDFYLGMYAVTQAEYKIVTGLSPSQFQGTDSRWRRCRGGRYGILRATLGFGKPADSTANRSTMGVRLPGWDDDTVSLWVEIER